MPARGAGGRAGAADGGEILVSSTVYDAIADCEDITVGSEHDAELEGFSGSHTLYSVRSASASR